MPELYKTFVDFDSYVNIKCLQSDGGGSSCLTKQTKNGISHQVSCPNSLQQNGKAKHKHHIIVEIGLFQLLHSQVSNLF